jgi:hypothetical protein
MSNTATRNYILSLVHRQELVDHQVFVAPVTFGSHKLNVNRARIQHNLVDSKKKRRRRRRRKKKRKKKKKKKKKTNVKTMEIKGCSLNSAGGGSKRGLPFQSVLELMNRFVFPYANLK